MDRQDTFFRYYGQFLGRLLKDSWEWPRDNGLIAGAMAMAPPLVAFIRDRTFAFDWKLFWTTLALYGVLIGVYLVIQSIRTPWKLDSDLTKELQTARDATATSEVRIAELNQKYFNDRPRLGLNVHSVQGETNWRTTGVPVVFTIQHLGGRIPTSISFDSVPSTLGKFLLRFDAIPHADPSPHQTGISFEVIETGVPKVNAKDWPTTQQYQGELLRQFVLDGPLVTNQTKYDLVAHFKDGDDEREQTFHLIFDSYRFCFLGNTA